MQLIFIVDAAVIVSRVFRIVIRRLRGLVPLSSIFRVIDPRISLLSSFKETSNNGPQDQDTPTKKTKKEKNSVNRTNPANNGDELIGFYCAPESSEVLRVHGKK